MLQHFINNLKHAFHHMDGFEKAMFSFWSLGTVFFWATFFYIIFLVSKDNLKRIFKTK